MECILLVHGGNFIHHTWKLYSIPLYDGRSLKGYMIIFTLHILTHWDLLTPFGDINMGQNWLSKGLVAWRHQAITWTNVDLSSVRSSGIHLSAISWEIPARPQFTKISLTITYLKLNWNLPRANELTYRHKAALNFHFWELNRIPSMFESSPRSRAWVYKLHVFGDNIVMYSRVDLCSCSTSPCV